ncbi:hypothetical protein CPB85DRAFT_1443661 [Mucidula mucida]|nr:hypothetical protein CPB85DRAFT_1443661 [Mucidula mucida]
MAPLIRGKKFSEHGAGFMGGNGDCQAAGGAHGDTFRGYKNEEAKTICGIHVQFDHLVGGAIMDMVAKFACPSIWRRVQANIQSASKLGITGYNIYACNGYCQIDNMTSMGSVNLPGSTGSPLNQIHYGPFAVPSSWNYASITSPTGPRYDFAPFVETNLTTTASMAASMSKQERERQLSPLSLAQNN